MAAILQLGTQMEVEVILASKCTTEGHHPDAYKLPPNIYTIRMRYPRIIHAEVMTHRVFGRNARSSRAVPVHKMIEEVRKDPFVPWHWGKNQKGMQASEECDTPVYFGDPDTCPGWQREHAWISAANVAANHAEAFHNAGYHKQICNRLLEPFMYIDVLITATEWDNFLWLRDHEDAEPHLQDLARLVRKAIDEAQLQTLKPGQWHTPYVSDREADEICAGLQYDLDLGFAPEQWQEVVNRLSAARCARISYAPFDGDPSYERELERYNLLVTSERVHASPLEHQATPDTWLEENWEVPAHWADQELHGNLTGWIQARKLVPNEAYHAR